MPCRLALHPRTVHDSSEQWQQYSFIPGGGPPAACSKLTVPHLLARQIACLPNIPTFLLQGAGSSH